MKNETMDSRYMVEIAKFDTSIGMYVASGTKFFAEWNNAWDTARAETILDYPGVRTIVREMIKGRWSTPICTVMDGVAK